jgi:hypothetical protein
LTDTQSHSRVAHITDKMPEYILKMPGDNSLNGIFVDLAANHWEGLSNTRSLETFYNWTGICIARTKDNILGWITIK